MAKSTPSRSGHPAPRDPARPVRISKHIRQLNLVYLLLKNPMGVTTADIVRLEGYDDLEFAGGDKHTVEQFRAKKALRRRLNRDRAELAAIGIPIQSEAQVFDRHGERLMLAPQAMLTEGLDLEQEEHLLIEALGRSFGRMSDSQTGELLLSALVKLKAGAMGGALVSSQPQARLRRSLVNDDHAGQWLDLCLLALSERKPLRIRYRGREDAQARERVVEPWGVTRRGEHYYVIGKDRRAGAVRVFKLARFVGEPSLVEGEALVEVPADFSLEREFGASPFASGAGAMENVTLRFGPEVGFIIANEFKGMERLMLAQDGSVTLFIPRAFAEDVFGMLVEFAPHASVLSPPAMASELRARIEETLALYTNDKEQA